MALFIFLHHFLCVHNKYFSQNLCHQLILFFAVVAVAVNLLISHSHFFLTFKDELKTFCDLIELLKKFIERSTLRNGSKRVTIIVE
jgi:hypothetical protein